jgi:hypothetical protein
MTAAERLQRVCRAWLPATVRVAPRLRANEGASLRIPNASPSSSYDILTYLELRSGRATRDKCMTDLVYIAICAGFFAVAVAYTYGCEKLRGGSHD